MRAYAIAPLICVAFGVAVPQSAQAYNQRDAIRDCERHLQRSYHYRPNQVQNVSVRREQLGSFEIHGQIRIENLSDPTFTCVIHDREVVSLRVDRSKTTAEAIGKGILGAVLAGIAGNLQRSTGDGDHGKPHPAYSGQGSPFRDESYLKNACSHELSRHLRAGHGPVQRIRFTNAHLHRRTLDGDGVVRWRNGDRQRIHFTCHFDRRGRIHDGRYSYYGTAGGVAQLPAERPDREADRFAQVRTDCVRAVRQQVGGRTASVARVQPGENFLTVSVNVEGAQAPWICEHSSRNVMRVYYGAEG